MEIKCIHKNTQLVLKEAEKEEKVTKNEGTYRKQLARLYI